MNKNFDFPNEIDKIIIDVEIPEPVITIEERRAVMIKRFNRLNIGIFSFLMASVSLFMIAGKRPTISETENRTLAVFPSFSKESLLNGSFTDGISEFYNDTVPSRKIFKDMAASLKGHAGLDFGGIKVYTVNSNPSGNSSQKKPETSHTETSASYSVVSSAVSKSTTVSSSASVSESSESGTSAVSTIQSESDTAVPEAVPVPEQVQAPDPAPVPEPEPAPVPEPEPVPAPDPVPVPEDDEGDAGELSNNIMIYKKRGIPIYYGSMDNGREYASILNEYKAQLGDGVNVYSMVCPTAISFYWPAGSDISHGDENANLENIKNNLSGVTDINTIPVLNAHRSEHIYSRTDHHWQPRGAYYAASVFAEKAGVPFADLSAYEEVSVPGYVGTLYGFSGASVLNDNPEDFVYYKPHNSYTTRYYTTAFEFQQESSLFVDAYGSALYCTFMGGDEKIVHVETDAPNNRTLFIIKDSYGNALVPFLTGSFKNIFVVDMRYFDLNIISFMREHNATDLLFAMNTFSATGANYKNLRTILNQ